MSVTCADVVNRAASYSVANAATTLTSNPAEMIAKIDAFQHDVYTKIASENRFFFLFAAGTSTAGSAGRTFDTATIGNVERLVQVKGTIAGADTTIAPVDLEDPQAELAPRYYILGSILYEVGSDWGAAGAVPLTIGYASGPTSLDPLGSTLQTVSLPDRYADLLSIKLAAYLAQKDMESRDPAEVSNLESLYRMRLNSVIASLDQYGGFISRRFISPANFPSAALPGDQ